MCDHMTVSEMVYCSFVQELFKEAAALTQKLFVEVDLCNF